MNWNQSHGWLGVLGIGSLALTCSGQRSVGSPQVAAPLVQPGIDVLLTDSLGLVRGRRIGLVTNQAGIDAHGVPDAERLQQAGLRLVALFSPEHGFRGRADPGAAIESSTDSATGLPIYSLYGRNTAPTDEMLAGIDVMLVDLQDAGARYYTYLFATTEVMRSAARRGIPVVVLDRPNPIGAPVQGNVLDTAFASPVGLLAIPMRHGMTLGELALLAKHDLGLSTDLRVVPMRGWKRAMYFDQTGLPFIPPSPNLQTVEALIHYPGICLFEGTSLSVGRGTDHPFEQIGAPGIDAQQALTRMRADSLPGVSFHAVSFTPHQPGDAKYADSAVVGIRLQVTDRDSYDPVAVALALLHVLDPAVDSRRFDRLAGDGGALRQALASFKDQPLPSVATIRQSWVQPQREFLTRRRPYLIYPE